MKQPIELRRVRDFGQIINDSFAFLKENFKPLLKAQLIICGFFIVTGTISSSFSYMNMSSIMNYSIYSYGTVKPISYTISTLINVFILILTQAFIHLVTLCYISVYVQKNNATPTAAEVWGYFRFYFFRVFGSSIIIFFLLLVGFVLCLIPGLYLLPIMYLIIPIMVIENSSFRYAFNKAFRLIKNNWWLVFGVIFIMSLIIGIGRSVIDIPLAIIPLTGKFLPLKGFTLPVIILLSVLRNILMLAYVLPGIAICLCYFNLSEEKDGTGLLSRIEKLGLNNDDRSTLPSEEY